MAGDGRVAVRAGARAQSSVRHRAGSSPSLRPPPAHDRGAVERGDPGGRRPGRRRRDRLGAGRVRDRARDRARGSPGREADCLGGLLGRERRAAARGLTRRADAREPSRQAARVRVLPEPRRRARGGPGRRRGDGARRARVVPLRPTGCRPARERAARPFLGGAVPARRRRTGGSSRTSPARPLRRSTARASSSPSRRSPRRFSAASFPRRCRASKASSSPLATFRDPPASTSAATGSTPSGCRTGSSGSSSGTSSARASRQPRRWPSSETRSARSRWIE